MRTVVIPPSRRAGEELPPDVFVETAGLSHPGMQRSANEDQFLVATVQRSLQVAQTSLGADVVRWLPGTTTGTILLVADGMGGAAQGGLASTIAVKAIVEYMCNAMPAAGPAEVAQSRLQRKTVPGIRVGLASALEQADADLRRAASAGPASVRGQQMGTTATLAYLLWPELYVAHAGDSRCYLLRQAELHQLTTDHTYADHYRSHGGPQVDADSPWHHMLWNALGGVRNSVLRPEIDRVPLEPWDTVLLCSDGLTKHLPDPTIAAIVAQQPDLHLCCQQLVALANQAGGTDNVTVVLGRCMPQPVASQRAPGT
jgi:serine/threonine protein phosphatase PrpC